MVSTDGERIKFAELDAEAGFSSKFFDSKIDMMTSEEVEPEVEIKEKDFRSKLEELINHHSMENGSNTPDFILAEYLDNCLQNFDRTVKRREEWYGREPQLLNIDE